jgi:tetratricopeptide (TPR) repeat protein
MARLDRLGPAAKEVAQIGAVIGRDFSYELLASVAERPEAELQGALGRLVEAGLTFQRGAPPHAEFQFKHGLVRDAAYESLLKTRRKGVHQRIAEALAHRAAQGVDIAPEILAHHYAEAGALEAAARQWLEAGRRNARRSANAEAIQYFERALGAVRDLPDTEVLRQLELEIQLALIPVLMSSIGLAEQRTLDAAERAQVLCEEFRALDRILPVLFAQFSYLTASARLMPALEIARRVLRLGETSGEPLAKFVGHRAIGFCEAWLGNLAAAEREFDLAFALEGAVGSQDLAFKFGHDLRITGLAVYSIVKLQLGCIDEGRRMLAEAMRRAKHLNHPLTLVFVLRYHSAFEAMVRSYAEVQRTGEAMASLCAHWDIQQWRHLGDLLHLWASMQLGSKADPVHLVRVFEQHRSGGFSFNDPFHVMLVADAWAANKDMARADCTLDEALGLAETTGEGWLTPELFRRKAQFALGQGSEGLAEQRFEAALRVAQEQQARFFELCAARDLARLWRDQGRHNEARDLLAPIYGRFTEGFDTPDLKDAKALLDELRG